jgi:hypothetical protein
MSIHGTPQTSLAVAALLLLFVAGQAMGQPVAPTPTAPTPTAPTTPTIASIVFVGTVDALEAVTLPNLAASPNTSVVAVEKVLKKPDAIVLDQGDKVTVVAEGGTPLQKGTQALFFADGLIFGESLAVRLLSWEPVSSDTAGAAAADDPKVTAQIQLIQASADKDIQASIASADIIIVGRVKSVQPPSVATLAPEKQRVSEHNPDWQEAIIDVQSVLKGAADTTQVVVRFPASMDVMWAGYPKLTEGQEGTFLLQQDRLSSSATATLEGKAVTAYTVVSSKDVLSSGDSERIKSLLGR